MEVTSALPLLSKSPLGTSLPFPPTLRGEGQPWDIDIRSASSLLSQCPNGSLSPTALTRGEGQTWDRHSASLLSQCPGSLSPTALPSQRPGSLSPTALTSQCPGSLSPTALTSQCPGSLSPTALTSQCPGTRGEGQTWEEALVNSAPDCIPMIPSPGRSSPAIPMIPSPGGDHGVMSQTSEVDSSSIPDACAQLPTAQTDASAQLPTAQTDASGQLPTAQTDASAQLPTAQTDASGQPPTAQTDSSGQSPTAQTDTSGQPPTAQTDSSGQSPTAQTDSSGQSPTAQTDSSGQPPTAQTDSSGQPPTAQTDSSGQLPTSHFPGGPLLNAPTTATAPRQKRQPRTRRETRTPAKRRSRKEPSEQNPLPLFPTEPSGRLIRSGSLLSESPESCLPTTPPRGEGRPWDTPEASVTSTPNCTSLAAILIPPPVSLSPVGTKEQTPEVDSSLSVQRSTSGRRTSTTKTKGRQKSPKGQPKTCTEKKSPAKRRSRKDQEMEGSKANAPPQCRKDQEMEGPGGKDQEMEAPPQCSRAMSESQELDLPERDIYDFLDYFAPPPPIVGANGQTPEVDSSLSIQRLTSGLKNSTTKAKGRQKCPKGQPKTCTKKKSPAKRQNKKDQEGSHADAPPQCSRLASESQELDPPERDIFDFLDHFSPPPPVSSSHVGDNEQTPEVDSSLSVQRSTSGRRTSTTKTKGRQKCPKGQPKTSTEKKSPAKRRSRKDQEMEGPGGKDQEMEGSHANAPPQCRKDQEMEAPPQCSRPVSESQELDSPERASLSVQRSTSGRRTSTTKTKGRQKCPKGQPKTSTEKKSPAKRRSRKDREMEGPGGKDQEMEGSQLDSPERDVFEFLDHFSPPPPIPSSHVGANEQTPEVDSSLSVQRSTSGRRTSTTKTKGRQKCPKGQPKTSTENKSPAKRRSRKDQEMEGSDANAPPETPDRSMESSLQVKMSSPEAGREKRPRRLPQHLHNFSLDSEQLIRSSSFLSEPTTPPRGEGWPWDTPEASVTSTPDCTSSAAILIPPPVSLSTVGTKGQTPEVDSSLSVQQSTSALVVEVLRPKGRQKGQPKSSTEKKPPAKRRRKDQEMEGPGGKDQEMEGSHANAPPQCGRPMSESQELDSPERDHLYSETPDRSMESSLQVKMSSPEAARTVSPEKRPRRLPQHFHNFSLDSEQFIRSSSFLSEPTTPPRGEGRPWDTPEASVTSTPDCTSLAAILIPPPVSLSPVGTKGQTPEVDSSLSVQQSTSALVVEVLRPKGRQKCPKGQPKSSTEKKPPAKRRRKDQKMEGPGGKDQEMEGSHANATPQCRKELDSPDTPERDIFDFLDHFSPPPPVSSSRVGANAQTPEVDSSLSVQRSTSGRRTSTTKTKGRQKCPKGQPKSSTEKKSPAKRRSRKDQEMEGPGGKDQEMEGSDANAPPQCGRPMSESQELDSPERDIFDFLDHFSPPPPVSSSHVGDNEQTPEVDSSLSVQRSTSGRRTSTTKTKGRQKCPKGQPKTSTEKKSPAKRRKKDQEMEAPPQCSRHMSESQELDSPERDIFDFLAEISIPPPIPLSRVRAKEQTPEVDSSLSIQRSTSGRRTSTTKTKGRQKCPKGQPKTCTEKKSPAKRRSRKDQEMEGSDANAPPQCRKDQVMEGSVANGQEVDCCLPAAKGRPLKQAKGRRKAPKAPPQTCSENVRPPAKRRLSRKTPGGKDAKSQPPRRCRPRFELQMVETPEKVNPLLDESSRSSDLSIELSNYEEELASYCTLDEEEEEEEEELPQLLMQKKPPSITAGVFVWCKFRTFPFWPAVVKSMNRRMKKASVLFIDGPVMDKICRGLTVSLKTMKPFDCEESSQFVCEAKEKYDASIKWSLDMISDYRMRLACEHFTGSFIEYINHDMSYPVRKTFLGGSGETPSISSDLMKVEEYQEAHGGEGGRRRRSAEEEEEEEEVNRRSKRLLPDRTRAAYNRANEKLVHYIINRRMVDKRLLAVISGQQRSTWLHAFLHVTRKKSRPAPTYLHNEQVEQVYPYLKEVLDRAPLTAPCLAHVHGDFIEQVRFVLDVLLPEAVIYAIAGVHDVSTETAEEKFLTGRQLSNREREEFDWLMDEQMKQRSRPEVTSPT